jgi:hypothetical protein
MVDDTQVLYYQDDALNLVEQRYVSGNWTFQNPDNPDDSITGLSPGPGSAIVALSYAFGGLAYRSLFFIDISGNVCTSNTTSKLEETTVWSPMSKLSVLPASTGSTAPLAACVDTNSKNWNGMMLFYGDIQNNVRAFGFDFASPSKGWVDKTRSFGFTGADTTSGLACTFGVLSGAPAVNVYFRSLKTSTFVAALNLKTASAATDSVLGKQILHTTKAHH